MIYGTYFEWLIADTSAPGSLQGAVAHCVPLELDDVPIIEQDAECISLPDGPEQLVRRGRDVQRRVSAPALRYCLKGRISISKIKATVLPEQGNAQMSAVAIARLLRDRRPDAGGCASDRIPDGLSACARLEQFIPQNDR